MRKRRAVKRDVLPDPIYKSKVVTKLINSFLEFFLIEVQDILIVIVRV